jgi:hypothetical protein
MTPARDASVGDFIETTNAAGAFHHMRERRRGSIQSTVRHYIPKLQIVTMSGHALHDAATIVVKTDPAKLNEKTLRKG